MRKINWPPIIFGFFFVGMYYFVRMAFLPEHRVEANHALAWLLFLPGALIGYWLSELMSLNSYGKRDLAPSQSILFVYMMFEIISLFAGFGLLVSSIVLIIFYVIPPAELALGRLATFRLLEIVSWSITAYMVLWLFLRGHYVIPERHIATINGKMYWSGMDVLLRPWLNYDVRVYDNSISIDSDLIVKCQDGTFKIAARAVAVINTDEAKRKGVASINFKSLIMEARKKFLSLLIQEAEGKKFSEFINSQISPVEFNAAGLPIIWDGKAEITITK